MTNSYCRVSGLAVMLLFPQSTRSRSMSLKLALCLLHIGITVSLNKFKGTAGLGHVSVFFSFFNAVYI